MLQWVWTLEREQQNKILCVVVNKDHFCRFWMTHCSILHSGRTAKMILQNTSKFDISGFFININHKGKHMTNPLYMPIAEHADHCMCPPCSLASPYLENSYLESIYECNNTAVDNGYTCTCGTYVSPCETHICPQLYIYTQPYQPPDPPVGWICPKCNTGIAPWLSKCDCTESEKETV